MKYRLAMFYDYAKKPHGVVRISSSGLGPRSPPRMPGYSGNVYSAQCLPLAELLHSTLCLVFGSSRVRQWGLVYFHRTSFKSLGMKFRQLALPGFWGCLDCLWRFVRVRSSPPFSSRRTLVTSAGNLCISRRTLHWALGELQTTCMARSVNMTRQTKSRSRRQTDSPRQSTAARKEWPTEQR